MCGIAGLARLHGGALSGLDIGNAASRMTGCLLHRGPDDGGIWSDPEAGLALGHRRLSILDLSPEGRQPMASRDGRFVIVFNGEIYNHAALRAELSARGAAFRGRSDTEVMLESFQALGLEAALGKMVGMFAFALWDRRLRRLSLARDRVGEKPLYYGNQGGVFAFASELKAFRSLSGWNLEVDRSAIATYMRHGYIPAPHSIYKGIRKLIPGAILEMDLGGGTAATEAAPRRYWDPRRMAEAGLSRPFTGGPEEAADELESRLSESIRGQMAADVPLGSFLSGGIDSSLITALMQKQSSGKVRTFTIGFEDGRFNEAPHAKRIADHLGTEHTEMYVSTQDALDAIPLLPGIYDEPFSDYSQIPTYLVSKLTRRQVTVCLSGDGGDELFFGYPRYRQVQGIWKSLQRVPLPLRSALSALLGSVPGPVSGALQAAAGPMLKRAGRDPSVSRQLARFAKMLSYRSPDRLYRDFVSHAGDTAELVPGAREAETVFDDPSLWPRAAGPEDLMMFLDLVSYLPDAIMTKVDRASMAVSLETRAPFLDHRIIEFAWSLPLAAKASGNRTKSIAREVLYRYVPAGLIERPKMGFGFPVADWLRGGLRPWAEELLDPERIKREGYLHPEPVAGLWREHVRGVRDNYSRLWDILMFQAWLQSVATSHAP